jgi:membrane protease YdiL (CAAX protease family)
MGSKKIMNTKLDTRRIAIFILFSFGLSWGIGLIIYLTGGLVNSPEIIPDTNVVLALPLLVVYMWMPAISNILTRVVTREGRENLLLQPYLKQGWKYWLIAWFAPSLLTLLGVVFYFALYPHEFSMSFDIIVEQLATLEAQTGQPSPIPLGGVVALQFIAGIFLTPFINGIATFGEEYGWRAYLQQKFMPLGFRPAMLIMGIIWGLWHAPIIAMGQNYGLDYVGYPWTGILAMVGFTMFLGIFLGWVTEKAGSVYPAVIGHAVINGTASFGVLFLANPNPNLFIGPLPLGVVGGFAWIVVGVWLLWRGVDK